MPRVLAYSTYIVLIMVGWACSLNIFCCVVYLMFAIAFEFVDRLLCLCIRQSSGVSFYGPDILLSIF